MNIHTVCIAESVPIQYSEKETEITILHFYEFNQ